MVFTVNGAARAWTYMMSEALGSLVPVLAQSSLCGRAPKLKTRCHRGESSRSRYAAYVRMAMAIPSRPRRESGTRFVTAESQRLINTDATDPTAEFRPA